MGEGEEGVEEEGDEGDGVVVVGRKEEEDGVVVATEDGDGIDGIVGLADGDGDGVSGSGGCGNGDGVVVAEEGEEMEEGDGVDVVE